MNCIICNDTGWEAYVAGEAMGKKEIGSRVCTHCKVPGKKRVLNQKFDVLDHGYVILRDVMGTDQDIINAARISYHKDSNRQTKDDQALLDYLIRHKHTSPLEMPVLRFQVKLPIFVERQWVRHRTCSMNEMSGRYSVMPEEYYVPEGEVVRKQSKTNKQGRDEELGWGDTGKFIDLVVSTGDGAFRNYQRAIDHEVARELARIQLPLGTYTEKVWQMNLHNLLHFLKLRNDPHAQWEIQQYAQIIEDIVSELFPWTYASWKNHVKDAVTFSADEMEVVEKLLESALNTNGILETALENCELSKSRRAEFKKKLKM